MKAWERIIIENIAFVYVPVKSGTKHHRNPTVLILIRLDSIYSIEPDTNEEDPSVFISFGSDGSVKVDGPLEKVVEKLIQK